MSTKTNVVAKTEAKPAAEVKTVMDTKELAKLCGTTAKKLRRYLRGQKFQRTDKRWGLDSKVKEAAVTHFTKPAPTPEAPKPAAK